jgi:hypothetical protein
MRCSYCFELLQLNLLPGGLLVAKSIAAVESLTGWATCGKEHRESIDDEDYTILVAGSSRNRILIVSPWK